MGKPFLQHGLHRIYVAGGTRPLSVKAHQFVVRNSQFLIIRGYRLGHRRGDVPLQEVGHCLYYGGAELRVAVKHMALSGEEAKVGGDAGLLQGREHPHRHLVVNPLVAGAVRQQGGRVFGADSIPLGWRR